MLATDQEYRDQIKKVGEYKLKDTHKWRERAVFFQENDYYTDLVEDIHDWNEFWDEEERRIMNGIWIDDFYIPGLYYFYLNYLPIYRKQDNRYDFADVYDMDYHTFLCLEHAEFLKLNFVCMKKGAAGFSLKFCTPPIRELFFSRGSPNYIATYEEAQVLKAWSEIIEPYKEHINTHTAWYREFNPTKPLNWRVAKQVTTESGRTIVVGRKNTFKGLILSKSPSKGVGGGAKWIFSDEIGVNPVLSKFYNYIKPMMSYGNVKTGTVIFSGAAGELKHLEGGCKEYMTYPEKNGFYAVDNIWDKDNEFSGKKCGFFVPESWAFFGVDDDTTSEFYGQPFIDEDGNSFVERAEEYIKEEGLLPTSLEEADKFSISQVPLCLAEMFQYRGDNVFPTDLINPQIAKVEKNEDHGTFIDLFRTQEGVVKHKLLSKYDNRPILEHPIDPKRKDKNGVMQIWEFPPPNRQTYGVYWAGVDIVRDSESINSSSLNVIHIYKGSHNLSEEYTEDRIVAKFMSRPKDKMDWFTKAMLLLEWYNAEALVENNVNWFIEQGIIAKQQFRLAKAPQWSKDLTPQGTAHLTKPYGVVMTPKLHEKIIDAISAYIKEPIYTTHDENTGEPTVHFGIERIRDLQLLRELVNYRPKKDYEKGNYDSLVSYGLALLHAKNNEVLGVIPEDTKENANFNQKSAKLIMRNRFSHKNLKNYLMPIIYNSGIFGQPAQALPTDEKDELWKRANLDWMEQLLKSHLPEKQKRLSKNYNMAQGVIDVTDYIDVEDNEFKGLFDIVETGLEDSLLAESEIIADDLNFYPIVPTIINVLSGELLKKFDHLKIKAIDEYSTNEAYEYKKQMMLQYIQQKAQAKITQILEQQGITQDNPDFQQQFEGQMQQAMSLPEIQKFMQRNYKSNYEEWANRIMEQATYKYKLQEKELELFKHQLIVDEAYAEIRIDENDIDVVLWNPYDTLVIKPKHVKYTTDADLVARQYWTTIHDVVSKYRDKIDKALIEKYNTPLGVTPSFSERRLQPDDNQSLMINEKKLIAFKYMMGGMELSATSKVLITEGYWMSRRRLAKLTAVYEGIKVEKVVDDTFKVTIKPQYDKDKNLIAGEEVEYFYAPQVWKGTKVNFSYGSVPSTVVNENDYLEKTIFGKENSVDELNKDVSRGWVYIDVQPTEYQHTDSINPFKPKIPVVGCDGFEPNMNVGKLSLIDKTKAFQVLYNGFMNEIDKFAKTEIGLFYIMDQKLIPQKSLDGSWGKYNWLKFIMTAKDTGLGVVDNSASNMEGGSIMQQPTVVNLLKNPQFQSRIELANYCEAQILKIIGITPQRMGTINSQETATGVNQAINNSYSQTELYFFNHTKLMEELKTIILDAEKYVESKKPISRVQYLNSDQENMMFELDTEDLLLRRFNIYVTSSPDATRALEQLRQLAIQDNTTGASLLDKAVIIETSNIRDIKDQLSQSLQKAQEQEQAKRQHEQEMLDKQLASQQQEAEAKRVFDAEEKQKDRLKDMYIADVKAVGFAKDNDIDNSGINDALEIERFNLDQQKSYSDILNTEMQHKYKEKELKSKLDIEREKVTIKKQELQSKERMKNLEIQRDLANQKNDILIAKENAKEEIKNKINKLLINH